MPSFYPPDYVHLKMGGTNESQMQLMAMQDGTPTETSSPRSSSPMSADAPSATTATADDTLSPLPRIMYKDGGNGKSTIRWWYNRTKMERALLLFILFLLSLLAFTLLALACSQGQSDKVAKTCASDSSGTTVGNTDAPVANMPPTEHEEICTTEGCVQAANNLIMAMNNSVDPCENFYEYACGKWNRNHPIPDDMFAFGTFAFVREHMRQQMRVLLESEVVSKSRAVQMVKDSYKICMNVTELRKKKTKPLQKGFEDIGYWPMLHPDKWAKEKFNMTELLAQTRRQYGNEVFFQIYVYADAKNTKQNRLYIDQGVLGLGRGSRDYYLNSTMFSNHLQAYKKYIRQVVEIFMDDGNFTRDSEELLADELAIIEFEKKLATIIVPEDDRRNNTRMYNKHRVADLKEMIPQVEWLSFFRGIMPKSMETFVDENTEIIVNEVEYLKNVSQLIASTDERILANYVIWRLVQSSIKLFDDRFDDIKQDLVRVMTGQETKSARWKGCIQSTVSYLPLAAGSIYIEEHFHKNDKQEALACFTLMIDNLRAAFIELVKDSNWMNEETKTVAIEKARNIINHIGYPDFIQVDAKLDDYYKNLHVTANDTYFELFMKVLIWTQEKEFFRLREPFDKNEFDVSPAVVNAFYSPEKNAITFPAGILQPPFFSGSFPKAVNYGSIGAVIGHEITHGFDDQGSQFDKDGNLENWWNNDSLAGFQERKKCIIDQYSQYKVPGTDFKINGKLTQGENIADNGGVKEAYRAYRKYIVKRGSEEPKLPGLQHLSNDQVFFLSYAHFWCGHKKDAAAVQQVLTDEHSPEIFRVIGVLSNLKEFSKAYNCPKNSRLNPEQRCVVW
ncbi:hypothetical protein QR680_000260 [Steinernema hermaphroditum]|uniref:Peptidase M13 C-terminal domain-containing protein n=1 Tax=Steinernema hermaphroditum TaxID=289476 RepID=A0AA39GTZ5_9BILA|nr:hypothetical protein QR680_000260 [Steinernema hermaphroditum]